MLRIMHDDPRHGMAMYPGARQTLAYSENAHGGRSDKLNHCSSRNGHLIIFNDGLSTLRYVPESLDRF